jgi:hypothetical protein
MRVVLVLPPAIEPMKRSLLAFAERNGVFILDTK